MPARAADGLSGHRAPPTPARHPRRHHPPGGRVRAAARARSCETVARDRAITDAERDMAALAPVLAVAPERTLLEAAMAQHRSRGGRPAEPSGCPDGTLLGDGTPADEEAVALAGARRLAFSRIDGGWRGAVHAGGDRPGSGRGAAGAGAGRAARPTGWRTAWAILAVRGGCCSSSSRSSSTDRLARAVTRRRHRPLRHRPSPGGVAMCRPAPRSAGRPSSPTSARALNLLADRIDELLAAERERVADLSHRLRTPLTALRLAPRGRRSRLAGRRRRPARGGGDAS